MTTPTPGIPGAVRHDATFHDAEGNPVPKGDPRAVTAEVVSYDKDGNEVQRTYASI